jgi:hypothetical protein
MSNFAAISAAQKTEDLAKPRVPAAAVVGAGVAPLGVDGAGVVNVGAPVVGAGVGASVPAVKLRPAGKKPPECISAVWSSTVEQRIQCKTVQV